jgi:hypothetical protein
VISLAAVLESMESMDDHFVTMSTYNLTSSDSSLNIVQAIF